MAISQDLLEILACPACKAKVELKPDGSALMTEFVAAGVEMTGRKK